MIESIRWNEEKGVEPLVKPRITSGTIVEYVQKSLLSPGENGSPSLHDRIIQLPFYKRLIELNNIEPEELLRHFVNNGAIFAKLETLIKANTVFEQIVGEELFRYQSIEKDIAFFMKTFHLSRPHLSAETLEFLDFIDQTVQINSHLLLAFLYVQYAGLFLGRVVCDATVSWLKQRVKDWEKLPEKDRGVSYWDFRDQVTYEDRERAKQRLIQKINVYGAQLKSEDLLKQVVFRAFEFNLHCVESVSRTPLLEKKVFSRL